MDMSILVDEKLKTSGGEVTAFDAVAAENQSDVHKDVSEEAIAVTGKVKWFDAVKGYGFLIPEQEDGANIINQDILIHFSVLRSHGKRSLPEGTTIKCFAERRSKGFQATEISHIDLSTAIVPEPKEGAKPYLISEEEKKTLEFVPATVKWFNRSKGYGFVNQGEGSQDVFIHMEVLRQTDIDVLSPGDTIEIAVGQGERGLMVRAGALIALLTLRV